MNFDFVDSPLITTIPVPQYLVKKGFNPPFKAWMNAVGGWVFPDDDIDTDDKAIEVYGTEECVDFLA